MIYDALQQIVSDQDDYHLADACTHVYQAKAGQPQTNDAAQSLLMWLWASATNGRFAWQGPYPLLSTALRVDLCCIWTGPNREGAEKQYSGAIAHLIHSAKTGSAVCTALRTASVTLAYTSSKALPGGPPHLPGVSFGSSCTLYT